MLYLILRNISIYTDVHSSHCEDGQLQRIVLTNFSEIGGQPDLSNPYSRHLCKYKS